MIHLKHEPPEPQAYCDLRKVAGMSTKSLAAARKGLPNALFTVALYSEQQLIGLGRVIGDGCTALQVVDIVVHPTYQGRGYGKLIMREVMHNIDTIAEAGTYVSLMADYPADELYRQFGFDYTEPHSAGMFKRY